VEKIRNLGFVTNSDFPRLDQLYCGELTQSGASRSGPRLPVVLRPANAAPRPRSNSMIAHYDRHHLQRPVRKYRGEPEFCHHCAPERRYLDREGGALSSRLV
jgi:hypothetical protein